MQKGDWDWILCRRLLYLVFILAQGVRYGIVLGQKDADDTMEADGMPCHPNSFPNSI